MLRCWNTKTRRACWRRLDDGDLHRTLGTLSEEGQYACDIIQLCVDIKCRILGLTDSNLSAKERALVVKEKEQLGAKAPSTVFPSSTIPFSAVPIRQGSYWSTIVLKPGFLQPSCSHILHSIGASCSQCWIRSHRSRGKGGVLNPR